MHQQKIRSCLVQHVVAPFVVSHGFTRFYFLRKEPACKKDASPGWYNSLQYNVLLLHLCATRLSSSSSPHSTRILVRLGGTRIPPEDCLVDIREKEFTEETEAEDVPECRSEISPRRERGGRLSRARTRKPNQRSLSNERVHWVKRRVEQGRGTKRTASNDYKVQHEHRLAIHEGRALVYDEPAGAPVLVPCLQRGWC
jgi:hypothetical protein